MERCRELEDLARQMYEAVTKGDISFFERAVSRDEGLVFIGTAPEEWWGDPAALLDAMRKQIESVGEAATLVAGEVRAWRLGDVGWVADRPVFRLGKVEVRCRHTSIFAREDGKWKIVQHHFSIGVANETAFGPEAARLG
jgi:hypothetical protein